MRQRLKIEDKVLAAVIAECERAYPEEACGFLLGKVNGGRVASDFIACKNSQNELHAKDPKRFPRDARTAYVIDAKEQEQIFLLAEKKGCLVVAIVHSHPEHGVYFSQEDKDNAAPWGGPLYPNLSYVVAGVVAGKTTAMSDFVWDEKKKDFVETKIL